MKVLSSAEVLERLKEDAESLPGRSQFLAYYSSVLGGIVTESHLAVVPADDHLVHRGHGVFDTASVWKGKVYQVDQHLDRFLRSAAAAEIDYEKAGLTRSKIRQIILDTIIAAGQQNQFLRYWLSVGRGNFGISAKGISNAIFSCVSEVVSPFGNEIYEKGVSLVTSTIPMKPPRFATAKTTNYLPNALVVSEAERSGAFQGVWTTEDGLVAELATTNIGFSFKENQLVVPLFDGILRGVSVSRILELCSTKLGIDTEIRKIGLKEAKTATEVLVFGGSYTTIPVVQWDGDLIGNGAVGPLAKKLRAAQLRDCEDAWGDDGHLEVIDALQ